MNEHDETKIVLDGIARQVREISGRYVNLALNRHSPDDTASMMECANFRSSKQELR